MLEADKLPAQALMKPRRSVAGRCDQLNIKNNGSVTPT